MEVDDQGLPAGWEVVGKPLVAGNIDLSNRPKVKNEDGSISTVRSLGVNIDGKEVLIPTVVGNRVVSDDEAIKEYKRTGKHLGIFATPEDSTAFAQQLHENEAKKLSSVPDGWEVVETAKKPAFIPSNKSEWLERLKAAAVDVPIGMVKGAARMGQMIPGMTTLTDAAYGLPKGMSEAAAQPRNANQEAGGYVNDAALIAATAGAEAGPAIMGRSAGYISNPTVAQRAGVAATEVGHFAADTLKAIQAELIPSSGGAPMPDKVAKAVVKWGGRAVQAALTGAGIGWASKFYKDVF